MPTVRYRTFFPLRGAAISNRGMKIVGGCGFYVGLRVRCAVLSESPATGSPNPGIVQEGGDSRRVCLRMRGVMDESSDGEARLKPRETRGRKAPPDDTHGLKPVSGRASGINHSNVATPILLGVAPFQWRNCPWAQPARESRPIFHAPFGKSRKRRTIRTDLEESLESRRTYLAPPAAGLIILEPGPFLRALP